MTFLDAIPRYWEDMRVGEYLKMRENPDTGVVGVRVRDITGYKTGLRIGRRTAGKAVHRESFKV